MFIYATVGPRIKMTRGGGYSGCFFMCSVGNGSNFAQLEGKAGSAVSNCREAIQQNT